MTGTSAEPASIGPFVVLRRLGEGAMGVVYVGYDVVLDRRVAIKLVHPRHLGSAAVRGRMIREAQAMARLSSPYVVPVFQAGEHEDSLYLAMEYVEGQTLTAWLSAEPRPWQVVLRTVIEAGRGLAAAHAAGFIHRDFKPKKRSSLRCPPFSPSGRILKNRGVMRRGPWLVVPRHATVLATGWQSRRADAPVGVYLPHAVRRPRALVHSSSLVAAPRRDAPGSRRPPGRARHGAGAPDRCPVEFSSVTRIGPPPRQSYNHGHRIH
jgi:hypothetical protein